MRKYIRHINEDDTTQQTQNQQNTNVSVTDANKALLQQLVQLQANIDNLETQKGEKERQLDATMDQQIANIKKQMESIRMQLAKAGIDATKNENCRHAYKYSTKLFESVPANRTSEMFAVFKVTQDNVKDKVSYTLSDTNCATYAKRMIAYLNQRQEDWSYDNKNHWDDSTDDCFKVKLENLLKKGQGSYTEKEINTFVDEFGVVLRTNPMFSWIFGRINESSTIS